MSAKWSAVAVLRASGPALDVDEFVAEHVLPVSRVWRRGEKDRRGQLQQESGFNLPVADSSSAKTLRDEVTTFLIASRRMLDALAPSASRIELDVGLMVYPMRSCSVEFPSALLSDLAAKRIVLRISGYPCSDDEELDEPK